MVLLADSATILVKTVMVPHQINAQAAYQILKDKSRETNASAKGVTTMMGKA